MRTKATYTIEGGGVNNSGWWVYRLTNNKTGATVEKSRKAVATLRREGRVNERCGKCGGRGWYLERFGDSHRTQCEPCGGYGVLRG